MEKEGQGNPMMINRRNFTIIGGATLLAYLTNGCIGKDTAVKGTEALYQQGAISDPHIVKSTFGGYDIKGDVEGYGFKVEQPDMHLGGGADAAGIIDGDWAIVYGRSDFFKHSGARAEAWISDKEGVVKMDLDLPELEAVIGNPDLQMVKFNLADLHLNAGDELNIANLYVKNPSPFVNFVKK